MKKDVYSIIFGVSCTITVIAMAYTLVVYQARKHSYTVYRATINDNLVTCKVIERSKFGYDLSKCENNNMYFNVTNIEMTVGGY